MVSISKIRSAVFPHADVNFSTPSFNPRALNSAALSAAGEDDMTIALRLASRAHAIAEKLNQLKDISDMMNIEITKSLLGKYIREMSDANYDFKKVQEIAAKVDKEGPEYIAFVKKNWDEARHSCNCYTYGFASIKSAVEYTRLAIDELSRLRDRDGLHPEVMSKINNSISALKNAVKDMWDLYEDQQNTLHVSASYYDKDDDGNVIGYHPPPEALPYQPQFTTNKIVLPAIVDYYEAGNLLPTKLFLTKASTSGVYYFKWFNGDYLPASNTATASVYVDMKGNPYVIWEASVLDSKGTYVGNPKYKGFDKMEGNDRSIFGKDIKVININTNITNSEDKILQPIKTPSSTKR